MNKKKIKSLANKIHNEYGSLFMADKFDIVKLARLLGFVVGNARLGKNEEGFIVVNFKDNLGNLDANKVIAVNCNRSIKSKRFIIACELGHYFLDVKKRKMFYIHRKYRTIENKDADYFAMCLLIPSNKFDNYYETLINEVNKGKIDVNSIVRKLSNNFEVNENVINKKMEEVIQ